MKRTILTSMAIAALFTTGFAATAHAEGDDCTPVAAWTETINHPEGSHTETINHPEVSHMEEVEHPEVSHTETINHPAVTHDEVTGGDRYSYKPKGGDSNPGTSGSTPDNDPDHWQISSKPYNGEALGTYLAGGGNSWFWWTSVTETVIDEPAWTEDVKVIDTAAWTEEVKVIDTPASTEEVTIIDAEAWTETIEHDAVTCDDEPIDPTDPTDETPVTPVTPIDESTGSGTSSNHTATPVVHNGNQQPAAGSDAAVPTTINAGL